jgi:hypothetical protein
LHGLECIPTDALKAARAEDCAVPATGRGGAATLQDERTAEWNGNATATAGCSGTGTVASDGFGRLPRQLDQGIGSKHPATAGG